MSGKRNSTAKVTRRMKTWLISDDNEIALVFQQYLREFDVECPSSNIFRTDHFLARGFEPCNESAVYFIATEKFATCHFELIRKLGANSENRLVVAVPSAPSSLVLEIFRAGAADVLRWNHGFRDDLGKLLKRLRAVSPPSYVTDRNQSDRIGDGLDRRVTARIGAIGHRHIQCDRKAKAGAS